LSWRLFDAEAGRYESWYETRRGRRASEAETGLLAWLLAAFPGCRSIIDVGCGTGHFLAWLVARGYRPIGLDRAPRMLAGMRRRLPTLPALVADAHALPLQARSVDLVLFVTTLEFLEDPSLALAEAARIARRGIVVIALNRRSLGALSRRVGRASRGALLPHARDQTPREVRTLLADVAGERLEGLRYRCALLPALPAGWSMRVPFGDVVGVAALLEEGPGGASGSEATDPRRLIPGSTRGRRRDR
jgi:ubiquinone/menaquinone biosynthesis C-methylase UbiE